MLKKIIPSCNNEFYHAGYRYFKISMFGTGFLFGSLVTYLVCLEENFLPMEGKLGVAMGAGILCGLITMLVQYVGLFMTGFHLGFLLAVAGLVVAEMFVSVNSKWVPIGSVLGIGLLNALLCLKFQRAFSILATVVVGAVMMFIALDYAIDQLGFFHFALDRLKAVRSPLLCWFTWVSVTTIPLLSFLGCVLQAQVTGKNCDHRDSESAYFHFIRFLLSFSVIQALVSELLFSCWLLLLTTVISLRRALKFSQQLSNNHTASTQHFAQPHQLHPKHHNYKHHHTSSHLPNHQELLSLHDKRHHKQLHRMHHKAHNKQQNKQQLQNNNKNSLSYQHLHRARRANGDILSKVLTQLH